ncbi:FUSC family protein [uncultured Arcticibacterium sp.]|uniref:FUSC family protein n=1 Tax=uncultured Arcticibacterium sp. TaxID=2173042 RepID=UPI0030F946B8
MTEKELSELTDEELLVKAKKMKSNSIMNAALIGVMIGITIYGIAKNNFGLFAIIPLFFAFRVFNNPKNKAKDKALKKILKERDLE